MLKVFSVVFFLLLSFSCLLGQDKFDISLSNCENYPDKKPINLACGPRGGNAITEENFIASPRAQLPEFNSKDNSLSFIPGNEIKIGNNRFSELNSLKSYTICFNVRFPDASTLKIQSWNFVLKLDDEETHSIQIIWNATDRKPAYKLLFGHALVGKNSVYIDEFDNRNFIDLDIKQLGSDIPFQIEMYRNSNNKTCLKEIRWNNKHAFKPEGDVVINLDQFKIESFFTVVKTKQNLVGYNRDFDGAKINFSDLIIKYENLESNTRMNLFSPMNSTQYAKLFSDNKVNFSFFSIANSLYQTPGNNDSKSNLEGNPKMDQDSLNNFFKKIGISNSINFHKKFELDKKAITNLETLFPIDKLAQVNFIHFSGHGNSYNNKNYWLPIDYRPNEVKKMLGQITSNSTNSIQSQSSIEQFEKYLNNQALSIEQLITYLDTIDGGKRIYFILSDACRDHNDFRGSESSDFSSILFNKDALLTTNDTNHINNHSLFIIGFPVKDGAQTANQNSFTQQLILKWRNSIDNNFWNAQINDLFRMGWDNNGKVIKSKSLSFTSIPEENDIDPESDFFIELPQYFLRNNYFKRP